MSLCLCGCGFLFACACCSEQLESHTWEPALPGKSRLSCSLQCAMAMLVETVHTSTTRLSIAAINYQLSIINYQQSRTSIARNICQKCLHLDSRPDQPSPGPSSCKRRWSIISNSPIYLRSHQTCGTALSKSQSSSRPDPALRNKFPTLARCQAAKSDPFSLGAQASVLTNGGVSLAHAFGLHKLHAQDNQEISKRCPRTCRCNVLLFQSLNEPQMRHWDRRWKIRTRALCRPILWSSRVDIGSPGIQGSTCKGGHNLGNHYTTSTIHIDLPQDWIHRFRLSNQVHTRPSF